MLKTKSIEKVLHVVIADLFRKNMIYNLLNLKKSAKIVYFKDMVYKICYRTIYHGHMSCPRLKY